MSDMTEREPIVVMRERITRAVCIDCEKPVFSIKQWRCDDCAEKHWNEVRDSEEPMFCDEEDE